MRKQYVIVQAWVPDVSEGHPEHPIVLPDPEPPVIWPDPGPLPPLPGGGEHPEHPIVIPPEGVHPMPPIYLPPSIWPDPGPLPPLPGGGEHPEHPIVIPPDPEPPTGGEHPEHPIYWPPVIWPGPGDPDFPGGGRPPVDVGAHPEHPIVLPEPPLPPVDPDYGVPVFPEDGGFEHPDLPDLNMGDWLLIKLNDGSVKAAFVPWTRATPVHPIAPQLPPENSQPGEWIVIAYKGNPAWAWMPTRP